MRQGKFGVHGSICSCNCMICFPRAGGVTCAATECTFQSLTTLWESLQCPRPVDSVFHNKKCLCGLCGQCGTKRIALCPYEENENASITFKVFVDVETGEVDEEGHTTKRKDLVVRNVGIKSFISLFRDKLTTFIKHNYTYRWQADQFKECLQNFPNDAVVSVVDFAENYSFKVQNEIQSMHWYSNQVTILVHICYICSTTGDIKKSTHFYISDDKTHDTLFVQHCFSLHMGWLKEQNCNLKRHWV